MLSSKSLEIFHIEYRMYRFIKSVSIFAFHMNHDLYAQWISSRNLFIKKKYKNFLLQCNAFPPLIALFLLAYQLFFSSANFLLRLYYVGSWCRWWYDVVERWILIREFFFQCIELMNFKSSTSATFFIYLFTLISCLFIIQFNLVLATEIWSVEELKDGYVTRQNNWV